METEATYSPGPSPAGDHPESVLGRLRAAFAKVKPTDRRITENGRRVLLVASLGAFALLLAATIFHIQQMFIMACVIGGLLPVSYYVSLYSLSSLETQVATSARGVLHERQVARLIVRVTNLGRLPRCFCDLAFKPPEGLSLCDSHAPVATILGGETVEVELDVVAQRRGVYRLTDLQLETTDLLGLFEFVKPSPGVGVDMVVYPEVYPLSLLRAARSAWAGDVDAMASNRAGSSIEFYGVRDFLPGDELRRIHWRTTARTGKLSVVEFEDVVARSLTVVIDVEKGTERGPIGDSTLDCAARAAASLATLACSQGVGFELIVCAKEDLSVEVQPGDPSPRPILEALAPMVADGEKRLSEVCLDLSRRSERGRPILLFSPRPAAEIVQEAFPLLAQGMAPTLVSFRHPDATVAEGGGRSVDQALSVGARLVSIRCDAPLALQLEELLLD